MHHFTSTRTLLGVALLCAGLTGCGDDSQNNTTDTGGSTTTASTTSGGSTGGATDNPTTTTPTTTDPTATTDATMTGGSSGGGQGGWAFADDPYEAYTQIDRHGAVEAGTAGIAAAQGLGLTPGSDIKIRDMYNASNPAEDAANMWLGEIANSVMFFHGALDDDILALKLVPATFDDTVAQAGPVIIPDTIKYDPTMPTGYPNGRKLTDPVVDITLAAVLLKLGPNQPLTLFADLPLNPPKNDVDFKAEFPYLAPPHAP